MTRGAKKISDDLLYCYRVKMIRLGHILTFHMNNLIDVWFCDSQVDKTIDQHAVKSWIRKGLSFILSMFNIDLQWGVYKSGILQSGHCYKILDILLLIDNDSFLYRVDFKAQKTGKWSKILHVKWSKEITAIDECLWIVAYNNHIVDIDEENNRTCWWSMKEHRGIISTLVKLELKGSVTFLKPCLRRLFQPMERKARQ